MRHFAVRFIVVVIYFHKSDPVALLNITLLAANYLRIHFHYQVKL